ncbi:MAG: flagellar hook-basal body complex protein [Sulfurimonas sp.]|jgi:flagellar hook protein FlgE|nr:flagellar hook-basal body complex protein [Sulfurimonadaceae bacterium]
MIQGFYTGINGLMANQDAIDIISDNVANINTVGFRGYDAEFANLFEKALMGTGLGTSVTSQIGLGVRVNATAINQSSGSLLQSDRNTDLAIAGDGWFGVEKNGETFYTRDGRFGFDASGTLVSAEGFNVLGTLGGNVANGVLSPRLESVGLAPVTSQQKISLPTELYYPVDPTKEAKFFGNLGTEDEIRAVNAKAIDSSSNINTIRVEFSKSIPQVLPGTQWDATATAMSLDGTQIYDVKSGQVSFDSGGALISSTLNSIDNNGTSVTLDFGSGYSGLFTTNYDSHLASSSDGVIGGDLSSYSVAQNGQILASFTNGRQSSVGSIALFHFANDRALDRAGDTKFRVSANSGQPFFYTDSNGNPTSGSAILSNRLENSNVALDSALTNLIIMQRSYGANAKTITTSDEMIQKALSMRK